MGILDWSAATSSAAAAWVTAAIYAALGTFGWAQIRQGSAVRELQTRPYVVVDFDLRRFVIYIAIRNTGATPARDIVVTFDKPLESSLPGRADKLNSAPVLTAPIPMMAPGRVIRLLFDVSHQVLADPKLPRTYTATVTYSDHGCSKTYRDPPYVLDLNHYMGVAIDPKGLPELVESAENIGKELAKWTDGTKGLLAFTVDRRRSRTRNDRPFVRSQARRVRQTEGWTAYVRWQWDRWLRRFGWR